MPFYSGAIRMRAFSLRTLLIGTAVVALCLVILGRPSLFWTRLTLTAALATLGWWMVLAFAAEGERRRFGIAATIIGLGYLAIALAESPRSQVQNQERYVLGRVLITHQLLESMAKLSGAQYPTTYQDFSLWDSQMFNEGMYIAASPPPGMGGGGFSGGSVPVVGGGGTFGGGGGFPGSVTFVPGASPTAKYQYYLISGHCLFAILFGIVAGCAARRWLKPQSAAASTQADSP
jgi:uncharacterized membrane protein YgcG